MASFAKLDAAVLERRGLGARAAFGAFRRSAANLIAGRYRQGTLGLDPAAYAPAARRALDMSEDIGRDAASAFFNDEFLLLGLAPDPASHSGRGFVTGYYEPEVEASDRRVGDYRHPLYGRPDDLVSLDDVNRPPGMDPSFRFARRLPSGLLDEYPDRASIERGFLAGRSLEIAWLKSPVDAFFIHIQGSARLRMRDGGVRRVGYAAKTGHPFTAIGRVLVEGGELTLAEADMAGIRDWLARNPERLRGLFDRNRSFIFFSERKIVDGALGPVGAANVSLTPLASIAVDRERGTYGVPYLLSVPDLAIEGAPFERIVVAQDTGSAILGDARADLFVGSGDAAGAIAGAIRHPGDFAVLVPKPLATRLLR